MTFVDVPAWQQPRQTEASFLEQVRTYARLMGWACYHQLRSEHSEAGFPDLVMVRRPRVVFAELKSQRGTLSDAQRRLVDELRACGQECYVWRPSDWRSVERILGR